ncbi:MAG TPA: hypothetical protein VFH56_02920 [Acidimicrobiales bacterium]|nr:hypothetical protein [Acidimicrobiales bacterium]
MSEPERIRLTPKSWDAGVIFWKLFKDDGTGLLRVLGIEGSFNKVITGISCATCGALPKQPCTTSSGKPASRMHRDRVIAFIAAIYTYADQIVIQEEEHIEDVLQ